MFSIRSTVKPNTQVVQKAISRSAITRFGHAGASISKVAKGLIVKRKEASAPGQPPTTRGRPGKNLRGAVRFQANKESAIVGPVFSWVGTAGEAQEFGGTYKGDSFDERSFMGRALDMTRDRLPGAWTNSIGK